jgi:hypothetical protein
MYEIPNLPNRRAIFRETHHLNSQNMNGKIEKMVETETMAYEDRFYAHNVRGEQGFKKRRK